MGRTCSPRDSQQESRHVTYDQLFPILYQELIDIYKSPQTPSSSNSLFGIELTFTNDTLIELARSENETDYKTYSTNLLNEWIEQVRLQYPFVHIGEFEKDSYGYVKVTLTLSSCDVILYLHSDDWVFEVGSSPMTSLALSKNLSTIQQILFDTAVIIGLKPHDRIGGGHIHLDKQTNFGNDSILFRNFLVDLMNRPELFLGGLALDLLNAPPLAILSKEQQEIFGEIIDEFDKSQLTIDALCEVINRRVYYKSYISSTASEMNSYNQHQSKYHAINLLHEQTIEIRGIHPQQSAQQLLCLMKLWEGRIEKLKHINKLILFEQKNLTDQVSWTVDRNIETYQVNIDPNIIEQCLADYIKDAGLQECYSTSDFRTSELSQRLINA
ncbi:unnamed protein product [Didymodactylos carnosus]|uniref:Uncharacterized protein n=1 Tax=Didymodactylos carnosus TaxID=1234261 RepID=A0A815D687_9BILA|nr:unnamed protein product [Didymodactylos carnosus]CAF1289357.1 unnamed protein product [Didymodactylos carnosus]CAF3898897.1 unnamed protein product [Didymodactylos carnosus]CAF4093869.1 unnamed protein product [Didymodactylos carnosus]